MRPEPLNDLQRIDYVPLRLRHLLPLSVAHQRMNVTLPEGHAVIFLVAPAAGLLDPRILLVSFHEVAAEHNHPCHPEKQNLVCRLLLEKKKNKQGIVMGASHKNSWIGMPAKLLQQNSK